jgi:rhamnose transport system permease protein
MSEFTSTPVLRMSPNGAVKPPAQRPSLRSVVRWESGLIVVLAAALWFGFAQPNFASGTTVFFMGYNMGEIAIMALPLMFIVMVGEIDLSVASMLGLSGTVMGVLFQHGWNIYLAMLAALVVGALGGALNGVLIAKLGLPSIAVTIGTLGLFRGLAEPLLGANSVSNFPASLTKIGAAGVFGTHFSFSTLVFVILAVLFGIVLHATPFGRSLFAIGLQSEAARFSGVRVDRIKFWLFVLSGVLCAFAGILFSLKNASARYDQGTGLELNVVAVVLFGGVSIFGGRGTVFGVVLSVLIFGILQSAMTIININPQIQNIIIGVLLLISVIIPNGGEALRRIQARVRRTV